MPRIEATAIVTLLLNLPRTMTVTSAVNARIELNKTTRRVQSCKFLHPASVSDSDILRGTSSSWTMLMAQASMSFRSQKWPSGSSVRPASNFRIMRRWNPSLLLSRPPKKVRWSCGLIASRNLVISLGSDTMRKSLPCGSFVSVPNGPVLKNHTVRP